MSVNKVSIRIISILCMMLVFCRADAQSVRDSLQALLQQSNLSESRRADLICHLAWEMKSSDPKIAGLLADSALQIAKNLNYEHGIADALHTKGMVYWYLSDYQEAANLFFQSLEIREKLKDTLGIARSYNNIGNAYFLQKNYEEAERYYRQSLDWRQTLRDTAGLIYSYNNLADVYLSRNDLAAAESLYQSALRIAGGSLDGQAFIHRNLGLLRIRQGRQEEALQHFQTSKELSEQTNNINNLALALVQIAQVHLQNKDYQLVIKNALTAFEISRPSGLEASASEAAQLLAQAYAGLKRFEEAYLYQLVYNEIQGNIWKKQSQNSIIEIQAKHELADLRSDSERALLQKQKQISRLIILSLACVFIVVLSFLFFRISRYRTQMKTALLLEEKNEAIQKQNEALLKSNIALERYAFVASHDLKEPLRTVGSYASLLKRRYKNQLDEDGLSFIQNISNGVDQMSMLLEDLLTLAKAGSESEHQKSLLNLNELVDHVLNNLNARITEQNAQIEKTDMPNVYMNPSHGLQLFQNLLSNALKFSDKEQCLIRIGCEKKVAHYLFSISDNGMGIDPEWQDKVFLPFHRLAHKGKSGAGLGLAICDKIVRLYGGTIWVESEPGNGSTFYFTLPAG